MPTSVYDLALNISTNIASLETGMAKAADVVNRAAGQMGASFASFNSGIEAAIGSVTRLAGIAGVGLGVGAFAGMIASSIAGQAELSKLAERTGATVEALSAMRTAAKYAGVDMDAVASGLQKFAKNVVAAQEGTGKQAAALQALGFNAKTFATQFVTTDQAILAVAKSLNQYSDGLGKTAIEQTLLGKSGANLAVFMRELAERGLDNVKVTTEQAKAAKALEDSITKLKNSFAAFVNSLATTVVPILQKVIDGMDTFKTIGIAAIAAFVVWPVVLGTVAGALTAYREACIGAALASELLGIHTSRAALLLGGIKLPAELAAGGLVALKAAGTLLFAAFAGWEIGKWLSANFLEARLAGIALVDGLMTGWENIKFGAQVAWEAVKFAFGSAVESMKVSFGNFIVLLGQGLSYVPGLAGMSEQVVSFGQSLQATSGGALASFKTKVAELGDANEKAKAKIHAITSEMVDYELSIKKTAAALEKKPPPPVPEGHIKAIKDATKELDAYQKALAAVAKASVDSQAKSQLEAISISQEQVKRLYDRGVIDFKRFWDAKTALQRTAIGVQEAQLVDDLAIQQRLVEGLQGVINNVDPSKFKTYAEYQKVIYDESAKLLTAFAGLIKVEGDLNVVRQKGAEIGKDYIEALIAESDGHLKSIKALDNEIVKRLEDNEAIGLTQSQVIALTIARVEEQRVNADLSGPNGAALLAFYDDQIDRLHKLADATSAGENKARLVAGWQDLFKGAADAGAKFLTDFVQHGGSAFKNLWADFKTWALEALAKIAAQKIIVSIAGSLGLGGIATNALAGSGGPLGALLGGGAPGGGFGGLNDIFGGLSSSFSSLTDLLTGNFGNLVTSASVTTEALVAGTAGIGSFTGALMGALPVLGLIGLALPLISGLFGKGGGPKSGGFAQSEGSNIERFFTPSESDAKVKSIVDALGVDFQAQMKLLGGKGAASFALGFDTDPQGTAQNRVSAGATVNGQRAYYARDTEVGRDDAALQAALSLEAQRVVLAALKASQLPADIAHLFDTIDVGTASAEQITAIERTAATYAAINAAIADLSTGVQDHFTEMLDGTQKTADAVLVVVSIIHTFGDAIEGIGPKLEALDPASLIAFVDALGGAAAATASFAYLGQNFLTTADRLALSTKTLNLDFANLGVAIPATHAQFLTLLNSFDLTTEAGRTLYASVLALAPLFVTVHGTADQAGTSLNGVASALSSLAQSAQDFFNANFYSDAERAAKKYADELKQVSDASLALGIAIPTSVAGFRALLEGIDQSTDAGRALYAALIVLAPAVFDLSGAAAAASARVDTLVNSIGNINPSIDARSAVQQTIDTFLSQIATVAGQTGGEVGDKLALQVNAIGKKIVEVKAKISYYEGIFDYYNAETLGTEVAAFTQANAQLVRQLAEFTTLKAQYGGEIAGQLIDLENWYADQRAALAGNSQALAILGTIFGEKWAAIIAGTKTGVDGTIDQLQRLRDGIANYLKGLQVGNLSPLTPMEKLAQAQVAYENDLAKAQAGDQTALGDITKFADTYLTLARDAFASSQAYTDIFSNVTGQLGGLAGSLPTGESYPVVSDPAWPGLSSALPANGDKMASQADLAKQTAAIIDALAAHANAGTEDTQTIKTAVERGAVWIADATSPLK